MTAAIAGLASGHPAPGLHLIPVPVAATVKEGTRAVWTAEDLQRALPADVLAFVRTCRHFRVESARTARAFLKAAGHPIALRDLDILEIGHEPDRSAIDHWLAPLTCSDAGVRQDVAILSESGCPGIADPGATLVARAHQLGIVVHPWAGPSSILLALMASGLNGQSFRFHGYLPQDRQALQVRLRQLQADAKGGETQLCIETPYRNRRLYDAMLEELDASLRLCLAVDLTGPEEFAQTRTVQQWRQGVPPPTLDRRPAVFLLGS